MDLLSWLIFFLTIRTFSSNANIVRRQTAQRFMSINDFMLRMEGKIHSTEDFLKYVGGNITVDHVSEKEDRILIGGAPVSSAAEYDPCSPRNTTYSIPPDPSPHVMLWPLCTRVKRCGGCPMNPRMTCVASKKVTKSLKVLRTEFQDTGDTPFVVNFQTVLYESEEECEARCLRSPNECNSNQHFSYYECDCVCMNYATRCDNGKYFDTDHCMCKCVNIQNCPGDHTVFDHGSCGCRPMNTKELMLSGGIDEDELTEFLNARRNRSLTSSTASNTNLTTSSQTTGTSSNTTVTVQKNVTAGTSTHSKTTNLPSTSTTSATTSTSTTSTTPSTTTTASTTRSTVTSKPPTLGGGICNNCLGRAIPLPTGTCLCLPPFHTTTTLRPSCPRLPCPPNWSVGRIGGQCICQPLGFIRRRRNVEKFRRAILRSWRQSVIDGLE